MNPTSDIVLWVRPARGLRLGTIDIIFTRALSFQRLISLFGTVGVGSPSGAGSTSLRHRCGGGRTLAGFSTVRYKGLLVNRCCTVVLSC